MFGPKRALALLLALAACAAFLAHEPLLVLLGLRGERARRAHGRAACVRASWLGLFVGSVVLWSARAGGPLAWALLAAASMSLVAALALALGQQRKLWAELWSAATLVSFSLPVLIAAGLGPAPALQFAGGWLLVHVTGTCAARAYVYRRRDGARALVGATLFAGAGLLGSTLLYLAGSLPLAFVLACAPFALLATLLLARVVTFRSPKSLGWSLTAANLAAFLALGIELLGV